MLHINERKGSLAVLIEAADHLLNELFLFFDELAQVVAVNLQAACEQRIGQAPGSFRDEPQMRRNEAQMRLNIRPEFAGLASQLEVIVENLLALVRRRSCTSITTWLSRSSGNAPSFKSFRARL